MIRDGGEWLRRLAEIVDEYNKRKRAGEDFQTLRLWAIRELEKNLRLTRGEAIRYLPKVS